MSLLSITHAKISEPPLVNYLVETTQESLEVTTMATELRKTRISIVGDVPWGTHFCYFYETKQDLLDTLVPYFKAGLESKEFCVWVFTDPLTKGEARRALKKAVTHL